MANSSTAGGCAVAAGWYSPRLCASTANTSAKLSQPAIARGGVAIGTALIVPGDEAVVERIREASESFGGEVGVSAWNGFAIARFCAQDAARLRADMITVLGRASGAALPRLWLN